MFQELNEKILLYLNSLVDYKFIEKIVYSFADTPIFFIPIFLVLAWIFHTHFHSTYNQIIEQKKEALIFIFYSCVIGIIITLIIQQFIQFERPESVIENSQRLILKHLPDASFPSDHATVSFAFLTALFLSGYKKVGIVFLPFVIIMNLSRLIAGVHWPFDILAGLIVGVISGFLSFKILGKNKLVKKVNLWIINMMGYLKL